MSHQPPTLVDTQHGLTRPKPAATPESSQLNEQGANSAVHQPLVRTPGPVNNQRQVYQVTAGPHIRISAESGSELDDESETELSGPDMPSYSPQCLPGREGYAKEEDMDRSGYESGPDKESEMEHSALDTPLHSP